MHIPSFTQSRLLSECKTQYMQNLKHLILKVSQIINLLYVSGVTPTGPRATRFAGNVTATSRGNVIAVNINVLCVLSVCTIMKTVNISRHNYFGFF